MQARLHDLTVDSAGLLTNVRHGGMKKDLNLLLESDHLPDDYGSYSLQNLAGSIIPIWSHQRHLPTSFFPKNFPSWYKLHQYYQLYRGGGLHSGSLQRRRLVGKCHVAKYQFQLASNTRQVF